METELNAWGWTFMLLSLTGVWGLAIFCYVRILGDSED